MDDFQSDNLSSESNATNSSHQSVALGSNHFDDEDPIDVCDHEFQSALTILLFSQEASTLKYLYLKSVSDKEDSLMSYYSSYPPYSLCSIVYNATNYDGDSLFSSIFLSHGLNLEITKDSENIHDE